MKPTGSGWQAWCALLVVSAFVLASCGRSLANGTAGSGSETAPAVAPAPSPATPPASGQNADTARIHVFVSGKVQGVGFRYFTQAQAKSLGLTGWVKNLRDGRVELVAEGPKEALKKLLEAVSKGPDAARVEKVDVEEQVFTGEFQTFKVVQ